MLAQPDRATASRSRHLVGGWLPFAAIGQYADDLIGTP
jgi:hypothetical protein